MRPCLIRWAPSLLILVGSAFGSERKSAFDLAGDEAVLRQAGIATDSRSLEKFIRERTGADADLPQIKALVDRLGASEFEDRENATKRLKALGPPAFAGLRGATTHRDLEVAQRARSCIQHISQRWSPPVLAAAVRLLAKQRPKGAAETLVRFLPYADEFGTHEQVWFALDRLAAGQKELDPFFRVALRDGMSVRRAAAAYILGRRGDANERHLARGRLSDPHSHARLRAVQGLLANGEKRVVPVLIALLDTPDVELAWQAEELLHWAAGEGGPEVSVGAGSPAARKKCQGAWEAWWRRQGPKLDIGAPSNRLRRPGLVLVYEQNNWGPFAKNSGAVYGQGTLVAYGCDGRPRWRLTGLEQVLHVHWLPGGRVLLAERADDHLERNWPRGVPLPEGRPPRAGEVTERNLDGKVLWRYSGVSRPEYCNRLPNGNTVVASWRYLAEVTPEGKQAELHDAHHWAMSSTIQKPQRHPTGNFLALGQPDSRDYILVEVDRASGTIFRRIPLQDPLRDSLRPVKVSRFARIEVLPNGHYLVSCWGDGVFREIDREGKIVWRSRRDLGCGQAESLPSGNLLVNCYNRVVELTRGGHVVWEAFSQGGGVKFVHPCLNLVRLGFDAPYPAGFDLESSVSHRIKGLSSKNAWVRYESAFILERTKLDAASAVPALLSACDDTDKDVRMRALRALPEVCTQASLPILLREMKDLRPNVRAAACSAMSKYSHRGAVVLPFLLGCLQDENVVVRRTAANYLVCFHQDGDIVVPALIKALKDKDRGDKSGSSVGGMAAGSLVRFQGKATEIVPALIEAAKANNPTVQQRAIASLGSFPKWVDTIEPVLKQLLNDPNPETQASANAILKRLRN